MRRRMIVAAFSLMSGVAIIGSNCGCLTAAIAGVKYLKDHHKSDSDQNKAVAESSDTTQETSP